MCGMRSMCGFMSDRGHHIGVMMKGGERIIEIKSHTKELRTCPICGSQNLEEDKDNYEIVCKDCGYRISTIHIGNL